MTSHARRRYQVIPNTDDLFTMGKFELKELGPGGVENWVRHPVSGNYENRTCQFPFSYWKVCDDENHGQPPYNRGGNLRIQVVDISPMLGTVTDSGTFFTRDGSMRYAGGFSFVTGSNLPSGFYLPTAPDSVKIQTLPSMSEPVTKAWNGARPKIQQVGGLNALLELDDLPRMLRTTAQGFHQAWSALNGSARPDWRMAPTGAANQFLNHQFGWVPFLSDLRGVVNTYNNANSIIGRIARDNGRTVRRKVTFENTVSETLVYSGNASFFTPTTLFDGFFSKPGGQPVSTITDRVVRRGWGSGRFRYYLPEFDQSLPGYDSRMNEAKRYMDLYGVRVNPSNIYQAIPWSWAVDWVSNIGDYVSRASDYLSDGLVADYFYAMLSEDRVRTFKTVYPLHTRTVSCEATVRMSSKQRVEGSSPFGVSLSWANLTPRQIAIAGALGITAPDRRK